MGDGFSVDTEGLADVVPRVAHLAEQVSEIFGALGGRLAGLGALWGDDATGQAIAAKYLPAAELTLDGAGSMRVALRNTGDGLAIMANGFRDTELHNRASVGVGPLA